MSKNNENVQKIEKCCRKSSQNAFPQEFNITHDLINVNYKNIVLYNSQLKLQQLIQR